MTDGKNTTTKTRSAAAAAVAPDGASPSRPGLAGESLGSIGVPIALFAAGMDAMMMSGVIVTRAMRGLNRFCYRSAWMSFEDAKVAANALFASPTVGDLLELQVQLAILNFGRLLGRGCRLSAMALQDAEDAVYPLSRRFGAALEEIGPAPRQ